MIARIFLGTGADRVGLVEPFFTRAVCEEFVDQFPNWSEIRRVLSFLADEAFSTDGDPVVAFGLVF